MRIYEVDEDEVGPTLDISILNGMLNLGQRSHTPRSDTPADLDLARSLEFKIDEFSFCKVRSWDQEWESSLVILPRVSAQQNHPVQRFYMEEGGADLGPDKEIPTLDEMSTDISGWLTDNLHSDVVPTLISITLLDLGSCNRALSMGRRLTKASWGPSSYRSYPQTAC